VIPSETDIVVEVVRGSFVKRRSDGTVDYASPIPAPFHYGSVPGTRGEDGDPLDVVLLGPSRRRGDRLRAPVWGMVRLMDDGRVDDKLVCSPHPPTAAEWALVHAFFRVWVVAKRARALLRGARGTTRFVALERSA
jgi:inorganic pyrophosphatase